MRRGRVERFVAAFNRLDGYLKVKLKTSGHINFGQLITRAAEDALVSPEQLLLCRLAASIRNIIVHEGTSDGRVVVPTANTLRRFETVVAAVTRPPLAIPTFERAVEAFQFNKPLSSVLKLINRRDYSQFPVYRSGRFHGLLTENGITRWLAQHVTGRGSVVSIDGTTAGGLLGCEGSHSGAAEFAPSDEAVGFVALRFKRNPLLEAVLITKTGAKSERLLGIATRWDIATLPVSAVAAKHLGSGEQAVGHG